MIAYTELDNQTISDIFTQVMTHFMKRFNDEVKDIQKVLIETVIKIYETIKTNLLPTPKKSHYTFNLRDISKVFQGICNASLKYCNSKITITKLWYHEIFRVFGDRLINEEDRNYLNEQLETNLPKFGFNSMNEMNEGKNIIFCDFWNGKDQDPRHYQEVLDEKKFIEKIYEFQDEYNNDPKFSGPRGKNAMKLVLFKDACEHISRIVRIIRQPSGNTLLLGVGGSGRQSLAKMAIFISNHTLTYIELIKNYSMKSWREDIKTILMQTGL
jgi:dynein heavy chain